MSKVRCRFAPSPTGFLHIGNARTAIFNYLFAKQNDGEFILRIEDTDKERSTQEAIDVIFDGLKLLGLKHDGEVIFQSKRTDRYLEVVNELLASGMAYKCFHTKEELEEMRRQNNKVTSKWKNVSPSNYPNAPYVVRLDVDKILGAGTSEIYDMVQGEVSVDNSELDDMIVLRSDGSPVYHLAVVVDDHDTEITHVIRGDDHLTNTFRQNVIYDALKWSKPFYAHLPLIMDENGKKISKRTGAASVIDFIDMGYLPSAIVNYLAKLGWSSDKEFLSLEELVNEFSFNHVGASCSRLDFKKLDFINSHWIQTEDTKVVFDALMNLILKNNLKITTSVITNLMPVLTPRSKTIVEMLDMVKYLDNDYWRGLKYDVTIKDDVKNSSLIEEVSNNLMEIYSQNNLMPFLKQFCEKHNLKLRDVAGAIRGIVCKNNISPPLSDVFKSLPKEEVLKRLESYE